MEREEQTLAIERDRYGAQEIQIQKERNLYRIRINLCKFIVLYFGDDNFLHNNLRIATKSA